MYALYLDFPLEAGTVVQLTNTCSHCEHRFSAVVMADLYREDMEKVWEHSIS